MAQMTKEEERILELLRKQSVSTIVLTGKTGIGKSWTANKVSIHALKKGIFDLSLWVHLGAKQKEINLYQRIADQLSMHSASTEVQVDDSEQWSENTPEEEDLANLKKRMLERLSTNRLLLVLDDEGRKMWEEDGVIRELCRFLSENTSKVLITSVNAKGRHKDNGSKAVIQLKPLGPERSLSLLQKKIDHKVFKIADAKPLLEEFFDSNRDLTPAEVIIIAKLLTESRNLRNLLKDLHENRNNLALMLSRSKYDKVPNAIFADLDFLARHSQYDQGAMYHSELIANWMMEGYLGEITSVDEAFEKGRRILMELIDLHVLRRTNGNYVYIENEVLDLKSCPHPEFGEIGRLGLAKVLADVHKSHGIGEVVQKDGMIITPREKRKSGNRPTLMVDGSSLRNKDLEKFFNKDDKLQVLCLFSPRIRHLPNPVSDMNVLGVLILRDCDFLNNIDSIRELSMLTVLEVSNAKSLTALPNDIFTHHTKLQILSLSNLVIEVLPESAYNLTELECLVLRGCANIKRLKCMKKWRKLTVLDLSGALSFKNFADTTFKSLQKLEFIDLSNTGIRFLPLLRQIAELDHLSVNGCRNLFRLPSIKSLHKLQLLDAGGSGIKEFQDHSFESNENLKILNLSSTRIPKLPSKISCHKLYLKGCHAVEKISCLGSPEDLEVLDISGASSLVDINARFFKNMVNLGILNLSGTKVKGLPLLSDSHILKELLLSSCLDLVKLPDLSSLCNLEVLDLSRCTALTELEINAFEPLTHLQRLDLSETGLKSLPHLSSLPNLKELNCSGLGSMISADFLEHMSKLQILDLSSTRISELPQMPCFENLTYLSLRNCRHTESLPSIEIFTTLEILDLSGTSIKHLPSLKGLVHLRRLFLKDCLNLEELADFSISDLSSKVLPYGISELTQLEQLALPKMQVTEGDGSKDKGCHWGISCLTGKDLDKKRILLSGSEFNVLLGKNPLVWNKSFKDFHFSIHPIQLQNGVGGLYFDREEYHFKDICFQSMHFQHVEGDRNMLEIHDFQTFPGGVENVLRRANYILLLNNQFVKSLTDLGIENLKLMKGCWMSRCLNLETFIHADNVAELVELSKNLETLWISSAPAMKNLYHGNLKNLKFLYLDCCPGLSNMFPQSNCLQNIEVLHIKFCDGIKSLFKEHSEKHKLQKLQKLYLWELPKLKSIDCLMPSLKILEVGSCLMLKQVVPSTCIPENLRVINVQYCDTLCNLVEGKATKENCKLKLSNLERVKLWGLPELTNIGIDLASVPSSNIKYCPKLQH